MSDSFPSDPSAETQQNIASSATAKPIASFRFGLKSMAVLTLIAALIFLLINLTGALYGLLISFAIAVVGLAVVFFAGLIAYNRIDQENRRMLNSWLLASCLLSLGLFMAVCFAGGGKAATYFMNEVALKKKYSSELGFTFDSEQHHFGQNMINTIRITSVDAGSEFERAGFLVDDIIVDHEKHEFFDELTRNSGGQMTVKVVAGGSAFQANQLDKLPQRAVTFNVP